MRSTSRSPPGETRRDGLRLTLALLAGLLATAAPPPARAQGGERELLLDVTVNGQRRDLIGTFRERDGALSARAEDLRALGLRPPAGLADETLVPLDALRGVRFAVDGPAQRIDFTAEDRALLARELGGTPRAGAGPGAGPGAAGRAESGTGALLNYDLNLTGGRGGSLGAGYAEGRFFSPWGSFSTDALGYTRAARGQNAFIRLDSTWRFDDEASLRQARLGDLVSGGLGWTRPVRLGGVQVSSNFALRPDLITFPIPAVSGTAAVPSSVDVLVNGVRQLSTETGPGPFVIRQLPVVTGAGEVALVVRDALGRETVQTLPFYASSSLLAEGLWAYSAEIGWLRRNYGLASNDYAEPVAMGSLRHGLSDTLTLEAHAEGGASLAMGGAGLSLSAGGLGVLTASAAASRARGARGEATGWQASLGFERVTRGLSLAAAVTWASRGFADVAALDGGAHPRRTSRASLSFPLAGGALSVAYAGVERDAGLRAARRDRVAIDPLLVGPDRAEIVSATWTRTVFGRASLYATAYTDLGGRGGTGALLGLSLAFGERDTATAGGYLDQGRAAGTLQAGRSAVETGDLGGRAYAAFGAEERQLAEAEYLAPFGRVSGGVDRFNGGTAYRAGLRGAVTTVGGGVFLSDTVRESFTVVDTGGEAGIGVVQENRLVGRTDSAGRLLVPNLRAYERNRIGIEPGDVPADATVEETSRMVVPRGRSGTVTRFPVSRAAAARVRLADAGGRPLPLGAFARLAGAGGEEGGELPVGYDGEVFVTGLAARNRLLVRLPEGGTCEARFDFAPAAGELPLLGPVPCR